MLVGLGVLGTIVVENAAVAAIDDEDNRDLIDRCLYIAIASAWVLLHAFLGATIWRHIKRVRLSLGPELNEGTEHNRSIVRAQALSILWPCSWRSEPTESRPKHNKSPPAAKSPFVPGKIKDRIGPVNDGVVAGPATAKGRTGILAIPSTYLC